MKFSKYLIEEAKVAVSPGLGFGEYGDEFVRFALVENEMRTKQAIRGLRKALQKTVSPKSERSVREESKKYRGKKVKVQAIHFCFCRFSAFSF